MNELVEVKCPYESAIKKRYFSVLYSIKNRKFIKGFVDILPFVGDVRYRIKPGTYIKMSYYYYHYDQIPVNLINIYLVKIKENGDEEIIKRVTIGFYNEQFLKNFPLQVLDLYDKRPGRHSKPALNLLFNKIYDEQEHSKLLSLISQDGEFYEEPEKPGC